MSTTATRISLADNGRSMTLEEFLDAEEEPGYRFELARGVLEVTHVPNDPHGVIVCNLFRAIALYDQSHPRKIYRYGGAGEFRFWIAGMVSGRNPDVAVVLQGSPQNPRGQRRASLAVEVVSVGGETRDYQTKREEYLAYGLFEYWIVDPQALKVTVLYRDGAVWAERVFQNDQTIESLVLPGFATRVSELWTDSETEPPAQDVVAE